MSETLIAPTAKKDWEVKEIKKDTFSSDDLINAYFKGRTDQADQEKQLRLEKFKSNLDKAQDLSENIFGYIKSNGYNCNRVYLRVKDIYSYTSLFLINEDDYCNDAFLKVYDKTIQVKKEVNNSNIFDFTTILTADNENLDHKALLADGYILSYAGIQQS